MYNIYYVEDDENIRNLLTKYLEKEGYTVTGFSNSKDAISAINPNIHLWILDIMLEEMNSGYIIFKEIRKQFNTPVVFITAKDEEIDRIYGLEQGGEDYITKPFSPREVVLKINKIINRTYKKSNLLKYKNYIIDAPGRKVYFNEENLNLTIKEFDLLLILLKNIQNAIPRSFILNKVWEANYYGSDRVVDDLVRRLRIKMPELDIETIYGYGYRLV